MPQMPLEQLNLSALYLKQLKELLRLHAPAAEVWAYGSRVTGGAHEGSDLDLVLRNPLDLSQAVQNGNSLREAIRSSSLPMLVDVHLWSDLPASFHRNIEKAYVTI
ncbi:MAG: nucleotidyltransferase domain-containing protein [Alcaligenaceae bacterium]|nr:nucleotidyltransferase domain-containing protein [Alcaligenaceae bacterium]